VHQLHEDESPDGRKRTNKSGLLPARKQPVAAIQATLKSEDLTNCLYLTNNGRTDRLLDMMLDPVCLSLAIETHHFRSRQTGTRAELSEAEVAVGRAHREEVT